MLWATEFAYNNHHHSSIEVSPFFANYGYHPTLSTVPIGPSEIPSVEQHVKDLEKIHKEMRSVLENASRKQASE
ncbi:hypothetical protein FRC03_007719 [Tulasnella sp. 419]|nr:hypothetical protein FRC03_007719 [Tulasnella sp. 419]